MARKKNVSAATRLGILNLISFIAIHPTMIEMQWWVDYNTNTEEKGLLVDKNNFSCGSVGCIAGLTTAIHSPVGLTPAYQNELRSKHHKELFSSENPTVFTEIALEAKEILKLTMQQAKQLFLPDHWPYDLRYELNDFRSVHGGDLRDELTAFRYAQLIIRRLQFFLDTDGNDES